MMGAIILILTARLTIAREMTTMGQDNPPLIPEAWRSRDRTLELTKMACSPRIEGDAPAIWARKSPALF
jgi:hypothetical protein